HVEAAAFTRVTAPLVLFRAKGAHRDAAGVPVAARQVLAKVSRPEVARQFLAPPAPGLLAALVAEGALTRDEAAVAAELPVASDLCVESDSGGHTDQGVALALVPTLRRLRDRAARDTGGEPVRVGAAGGIGTPEAAAACFLLGADFVLTGSVNQCSPQAGTSDTVKDLLAGLDVQDVAYAPAGAPCSPPAPTSSTTSTGGTTAWRTSTPAPSPPSNAPASAARWPRCGRTSYGTTGTPGARRSPATPQATRGAGWPSSSAGTSPRRPGPPSTAPRTTPPTTRSTAAPPWAPSTGWSRAPPSNPGGGATSTPSPTC